MSRTPCLRSFFGTGSMPHSGMPGPPERAGVAQHQHRVGVAVEVVAVDARRHVVVVVEHHRLAGVLENLRSPTALITAPFGARLPRSHHQAAGFLQRIALSCG